MPAGGDRRYFMVERIQKEIPMRSYPKFFVSLFVGLLSVFILVGCSNESTAQVEAEALERQSNVTLETITVYKSPTCGCCKKWVQHLRDSGFNVESRDVQNVNKIKIAAGVSPRLASCHTAFVGDYVIEGHVPAADILRLLKTRPDVAGLTVPGMPMGSPGMEGARKDKYEVLTFTGSGDTAVFSRY